MIPLSRKFLAIVASGMLLLQSCATQPPAPALPDLSQLDKVMKDGQCSPSTAALIGAAEVYKPSCWRSARPPIGAGRATDSSRTIAWLAGACRPCRAARRTTAP